MICFTVYGDARPAGSKRAFPNRKTGRIIVTDDSGKAGKDWRSAIVSAAMEVAPPELLKGPLALTMVFHRRRPKSHYRTGRNAKQLRDSAPAQPTTRPDALKLARAVEDALTGIVYEDDSQIVDEHIYKRFGVRSHVDIEIAPMAEVFA